MTSIPFSRSSAAVTPSPGVSAPVKLPSWMLPWPQEGLRSFKMARVQPQSRARCRASRAPRVYCAVTFVPACVTTLPSRSSAGRRGVGRPP